MPPPPPSLEADLARLDRLLSGRLLGQLTPRERIQAARLHLTLVRARLAAGIYDRTRPPARPEPSRN